MIMQVGDVCGDPATRNQTRFDAYPLKVAGQRERAKTALTQWQARHRPTLQNRGIYNPLGFKNQKR